MEAPSPKRKTAKGATALVIIVAMCGLSVPCVGVLSAIAIPAFIGYLQRAKTAEASANLRSLFSAADAYYRDEHWGGDGAAATACAVGGGRTTNVPGPGKTLLGPLGEPFDALGFSIADPVYYQYEVVGVGGCDHRPGEPLYSFRAYGDLDGDGATSLFEISGWVGPDGNLERSAGIYRENENE